MLLTTINFCLIFLAVACGQDTNDTKCNYADFKDADIIYNLTHTESFHLHDSANLSNHLLNIIYSWDVKVPKDSTFDGFLFCHVDIDKRTTQILPETNGDTDFDPDSLPNFDPNFLPILPGGISGFGEIQTYELCENYSEKPFYVTDSNGTYRNCSYPCKEFIDQECVSPYSSVCTQLGKHCLPLPKDKRNVTVEIEFGRRYKFTLLSYKDQETGNVKEVTPEIIFCGHRFIEEHGLEPNLVYEFCRSEQDIDAYNVVAGPPTNLSVVGLNRDLYRNILTLTIQWKAPHDISNGSQVLAYVVSANEPLFGESNDQNVVVSANSLDETVKNLTYRYNLSFSGASSERELSISVHINVKSDYSVFHCRNSNCEKPGAQETLTVHVPQYMPCNQSSNIHYCDPLAECETVANGTVVLANCSCPLGYKGNGINPLASSIGTGCQDFNACVDSKVQICSEKAHCIDAPPPSLNVESCQCFDYYVGDGFRFCIHIAVVIFLSVIGFAIVCVMLYLIYRRRRKLKNMRWLDATISRYVTNKNRAYTTPLPVSTIQFQQNYQVLEPVFGEKYELDRSAINTQEIIGRGNFGVVHKAILTTIDGTKTVAVKSLTGMYTANHRDDFLAEISLLINLGKHENILPIEGVCTIQSDSETSEPLSPLLITEFMSYGDLLHFLWDSRDTSKRESDPLYDFTEISLYKIGRQVAHGMHFLAQSRIIHGDVAARNILIGENLVAKISDFGLANDVYRYGVIKGATERRVPFKWISPERMMGGGTPITWKSDVWSFGILLYEMVTLGAAPYPAMDPVTIFYKLRSGYRIPQPSSCSDQLYNIMKSCWAWESFHRPTFKTLENKLEEALRMRDVDSAETLLSRIAVEEEIDPSFYEQEIGRRDSTAVFTADETFDRQNGVLHQNEEPLTNGSAGSHLSHQDMPKDSNPIIKGTEDPWQPWSGDIPVSVEFTNGTANSSPESRAI